MKKFLAMVSVLVFALSMMSISAAAADGEPEFDGTYKIGLFMPLTGPSGQLGIECENATKLAIKHINEEGGILGKEVVLASYDDKSSPEEAVKCVTKMLEVDKVDAIIGSFHSGNIQACGDIVEEAKVPMMGTGTSPQWLQKGWTYLFRPTLNTYYSSLAAIEACKSMGVENIGIFYSQDEYGKNGKDNMEALCEEYGVNVVAEESMRPGDSDFTAQCAIIAEAKPDACYVIAVADNLPTMVKQLRAGGVDCFLIGEQSLGSPEVKEVAGEAADGVIFGCCYIIPQSDPAEAIVPEVVQFFQDYLDEYGALYTADAGTRCVDGLYLLKEAVERAGTTDGTAVRDAMYTITDYHGLQGTFDFSGGDGEGLTESRLYIIQDGQNVPLEEYMENR